MILKKPRTTIHDNLRILLKAKMITKESIPTGKKGRPIILWCINKNF